MQHEEETAGQVGTNDESLCIQLTGTAHRWRAAYRATDGGFSQTDLLLGGRDLHVPIGSSVVFLLKSTDYIYTLAIPEFGLKEIAVPGLEFRMALRPTQAGQFPLIGEELCGAPGLGGPGRLIVEPRAEFRAWLGRKKSLARRQEGTARGAKSEGPPNAER